MTEHAGFHGLRGIQINAGILDSRFSGRGGL